MWKREHCEPAALETSAGNGRAALGIEALVGALERQKGPLLLAPLRVGDEGVAYTPADAAYGSNPSRGRAQNQRPMDGVIHSPGVASRWRCRSIDIARAGDKDDNCGCSLHRPRAGFHQLPCAAHVRQVIDSLDNA